MKNFIHEIHRRSVWQVIGIYLAGAWVALQVVEQLAEALDDTAPSTPATEADGDYAPSKASKAIKGKFSAKRKQRKRKRRPSFECDDGSDDEATGTHASTPARARGKSSKQSKQSKQQNNDDENGDEIFVPADAHDTVKELYEIEDGYVRNLQIMVHVRFAHWHSRLT